MEPRVCRWGILGTAGIARKNWQAIALAGNATVTAVASRRLERSRQFVAECQAACPLPSAPAAVGGLRRAAGPVRRRRGLRPAPHRAAEGVGRQGRRSRQARPRREAGRRDRRRRSRHARRLRPQPRAAHGRRDVHAQPPPGGPPADARRRGERRPRPPHRRAVQLRRSRGVRAGEHPGRQPARAARLPGRPRLVHHPLRAVGDEASSCRRRSPPACSPRRAERTARTRSRSSSPPSSSSPAACRRVSTARSRPRTSSGPT